MNASQLEQVQKAMREKVEADLSGPAAAKDPGDPQWCWQKVGLLQVDWGLLETSYDSYVATLKLIDEHRVWEKIPEDNPFGTREAMLEALAIGDEETARREVQDRLKRRALQTKALQQHGGTNHHNKEEDAPEHLPRHLSGSDYLLARIKRDRPDVFERVLNGEFETATAAARAAGIVRKKHRSVTLGNDVGRLASTLSNHYTPEEFTELSRRMLQLRRQRRRGNPNGS